ncbi:MAG TPA: serine/threonine-protein kinase [Hyalangium sp.]|nr:serine/threonine-protein kinase [Hyalangium sp.]
MMEEVDPDKLLPGTLVDTFRVVRRLGGGAYGTVYLVEEKGVFYALKMARFREQSGDKRHTDERAQRELNCLLSLSHPYIARVYGHGRWPRRQGGYFYVVIEYVEGGTLAKWCEDHRATAHEAMELMDKVLEAVAYMHGQGIFHRDLKPGNILVRKGGKEPVLVDYGVAYFPMPALPQLTDTVLPPGTPRYTSPEALRFEVQHRRNRAARYEFTVADELYALGVTLYDLLTDPQPDSYPQPVPLGFELMPTPYAHEVNERVPVALSYFTAKLMVLEPGQRPVSAEAARRELAELLQYQAEEWAKRPLHPPSPLPPQALPAAPVQVKSIPGQPSQPVEAAAASSSPAAPAHPGELRRWTRAKAVAVGAVALGALLACGVYLTLRTSAPLQPAPVAEETPTASSPTLAANEEPLPAPPAPAQPAPTPEKGTPVNIRQASEAAAPALCSEKTPPPRGSSRWREWCKCAGIAGTLVALQAGCTGAQVRQSPTEECRKEAVEAMKLLDVRFGDQVLRIQVDLATPRVPTPGDWDDRGCENGPCLRPGPITSVVVKGSGKLVRGTLLAGHVFELPDSPGKVWELRWTEATLPNGDKHPVCIEGGQDSTNCPTGGRQICPEIFGDIVKRWTVGIVP